MLKNILSVLLILLLLLTFSFGYISDSNITDEDNFIIDIERMDSLTSTFLNSFNNYVSDIKSSFMAQYLDVIKFISNIGESFSELSVNKVNDLFNNSNIFSFFQGFLSLVLAPFYIIYSSAMLVFNFVFLTCKFTLNLVYSCIQLGRVLS